MSSVYIDLTCNDCGGSILFNSLASGSISQIPSESYCKCIDRNTHEGKKIENVVYHEYATFIPEYLKGKPVQL